jgi:Flp pilus assembly protein TadD
LAIVSAGLLLALLTGVAVLLRRRRPSLMAGWCWYLVMLLPVIGVVQVGGQSIADRYTYLSLTGITMGFVWLVPAPRTRRGAGLAAAFAGCALLVLSLSARRQIGRWKDSETLLRHALATAGESWMVRNALGHTLLRSGRSAAAAEQFAVALTLTPDIETFVALGKALADQGDHEGAIAQYEIALRLKPDHRLARFDRGASLQALGRTAEAEEAYREALRRELALPGTFGNLGNILVLREMPEEAAEIYRAGICAFPDSGELWNNLGILEANRGAMTQAVAAFAAAVRLRPEWTTARENLDIARRQLSARTGSLSYADPKNYWNSTTTPTVNPAAACGIKPSSDAK